jgi:hypothetical protein
MKDRILKIAPPLLLLAVLFALPAAGLSPNLVRLFFITFVFMISGIGWNLVGGFLLASPSSTAWAPTAPR